MTPSTLRQTILVRRFARLLLYTLLFSWLWVVPAQAQLNSEGGFYGSNIFFFDPNASANASQPGFCGNGSVVLVGGDNAERALNFLVQKGLSEAQAAGVVGNLVYESGVDPTRVEIQAGEPAGYRTFSSASEITEGRGYGIAQWTSGSRQQAWIAFAEERSLPVTDLGLQLEFLWHELSSSSERGYDELLQANDVRQAAWIFMSYFERPASVINAGLVASQTQPTSGAAFESLNQRHDYATAVLQESGGADPSLGDSCDLNVGGPDYSANPNIQVDGGLPWANGSNCSGTFTAGAQVLKDFVLATWSPPVTSVGGYDCRRNTANEDEVSIHGLGRALDIMVNANTPEGLATGDQIRNWMINNSEAIGVQRVIWNSFTWSANQDGWRPYTGPFDHSDHLHVEVNEAGANMLTPWFSQQPPPGGQ